MCVKIITSDSEKHYDMTTPLENQLQGCKQIVVRFEPEDPSLDKFLDEIERFAETGRQFALDIKVIHNDNIVGAKAKKQVGRFQKDMSVNELIRMMASAYDKTDRKLQEIIESIGKISVKE